jgi:2-polyprenyl-6-methoxyphenol hydroxylase-like FAD-dependent oxidoreductase
MSGRRVLVVGAGIAGLTAAAALRRQSIDVDVLEIGHSWVVSGSGIQQQANVVRALSALGFRDEFLTAGHGFSRVRSYDRQGRLLAETVLPRLAGFDSPAMMGIGRGVLHQLLLSAATRAGARVHLGTSVAGIREVVGGVHVTLSDGTSQRFDLLVGADGLHSRVRQQCFDASVAPHVLEQSLWSGIVVRPPELDALMLQSGADGHCGACPVSATQAYLFVTARPMKGAGFPRGRLPAQMRELLSAYEGAVGALRTLVGDDLPVSCRRLETLLLPGDWFRGHVLLIGDAAHACAPHLGQGAGMAIEDAVVLAEEMGHPQTVGQALRRFMDRRRERVEYVWGASQQLALAESAGDARIDRRALYQKMIDVTARPL